jgi:hypothetical protein
MSDPRQILTSREALSGIDAALARRMERPRGWVLVDAESASLPSKVVHTRPWLHDPEAVRGFRIESVPHRFSRSEVQPGYGVVFLAGPGGAMDPAGYESVAAMLDDGTPHLVICLDGDGLVVSDGAGHWLGMPVPRRVLSNLLVLEIQAATTARRETSLPFHIPVSSSMSQDMILIRLAEKKGFREAEGRFRLRTAGGGPLGRGSLRIDFEAQGPADQLVVFPEGFAGSVEALRLEAPRAAGGRRFQRGLPVRLHLLFDRTTLDPENWARAFEALMVTDEQEQEFTVDEDPKPKWNLQIRRGLAQALARTLPQLHDLVKPELWWFADIAQPGVAEPDGLPSSTITFGHPGDCAIENLEDRLVGRTFGYATGMDLIDAVDELLAEVSAAISASPREQHAVLIVGDSPPPPADENDPIWQGVIQRPLRTNARCSPLFQQHLTILAERQVPVGWLFIRSSAHPTGRELFVAHYPYYQTLRENTLAALKRMPDLLVQSSDGVESFDRALMELFRRMAARPEVPSCLEIEEPA